MSNNNDTPRQAVERIGEAYVNAENDTSDRAREAFRKMARVNGYLYDRITVPVVWTEDDPYNDYEDMRDRVAREGTLYVFSGGDPHPYFSHEEEMWARAVHDWYGHLRHNVDFSPTGEYLKWVENRRLYPPETWGYFFTEVVAQVGAVHYLPGSFGDPLFEQKAVNMGPSWWSVIEKAVMNPNRKT